jgi:hypothetical protein
MSVGQWLNAIILDQAADEGIHSEDDADRYDGHGDDLATINRRLDDLGRQIARSPRRSSSSTAGSIR